MSTAPVLEFICLFTHDLRRKQKRWQDGRLKYHTYNKRVMVHDERGNYVGDSHWKEDYDLADGDELELERGSAIVQVAECTGSRDQDLSELVDKRLNDKAERQAAVIARTAAAAAATPNSSGSWAQVRQRPLQNAIITPTGHHGRAQIPTESPFESRQRMATSPNSAETPNPAKRRKREVSPPSKSGYAQNLFGATLTLSGRPMSSAPLRRSQPSFPPRPVPHPQPPSSSANAPEREASPPSSPAQLPRGMAGPSPNALAVRQSLLKHAPRVMSSSKEVKLDEHIILSSSPAEANPRQEADGNRQAKKNNEQTKKPLQPLSSNASLQTAKRKTTITAAGPSKTSAAFEDSPTPAASLKKPSNDTSIASGREKAQSEKTRESSESKKSRAKKNSPGPDEQAVPPQSGPADGPRTELRLKPRKKRGLLMMTESHPKPSKNRKLERQSSASSAGHRKELSKVEPVLVVDNKNKDPFELSDLEQDLNLRSNSSLHKKARTTKDDDSSKRKHLENRPEKKRPIGEPEYQTHVSLNLSELSDDVFEEMPPAAKKGQSRRAARDVSEDEDEHEDKATSRRLRTRTRKKYDNDEVIQLDEEEPPEPESPKGPRLEKLARKSIRSKEIFGFDFEDDLDCSTAPKQNKTSVSIATETNLNVEVAPASAPRAAQEKQKLPGSIISISNEDDAADHQVKEEAPNKSSLEFSSMPGISFPSSPRRAPQSDKSDTVMPKSNDARTLDCVPESQVPRTHLETQEKEQVAARPEKAARAATLPMSEHRVETRPQRRTNSAPMGMKAMPEGQDDITDSYPIPKQTRRLINPATRGKKAAKPSDAAGQMPQCPLPAEPTMPQITLSRVAKEQMAKQSERRNTGNKSGGAPSNLLGFSSANGGPWSREAYDLFG